MDWTIVVSVLVALLLWLAVLASVVALVFIPITAVFRGRVRGLMESNMAHCKEMFRSREVTAAASPALGSCCGRKTPEGT